MFTKNKLDTWLKVFCEYKKLVFVINDININYPNLT